MNPFRRVRRICVINACTAGCRHPHIQGSSRSQQRAYLSDFLADERQVAQMCSNRVVSPQSRQWSRATACMASFRFSAAFSRRMAPGPGGENYPGPRGKC